MCGEEDSDNKEPTKFQCASNKKMCLDISARCNGTAECPRGEDEAHCTGCRINEFQCDDGQCIRKEWRCDKEHDCKDESDEKNCPGDVHSSEAPGICHDHMFNCRDGSCIDMSLVCDGKPDCRNNLDESGSCMTACDNNPCAQKCTKSPFGPICSCNDGFTLASDHKKCLEIDECQEYNPCAQKCENTFGSFRCSCFSGFILEGNKISCKSYGEPKYILYSSNNVIWRIMPHLGTLWSTNVSKIIGMDVNAHLNFLYFTVEDAGAIFEYNLKTKKVNFVNEVGNPTKLAVDWITNNIYFVDQTSSPSIKVCNMVKKVCIRLTTLKKRDFVKSIAIDATNNYLFYAVLHYSEFSSPNSVIYRLNLDGTHPDIVVTGEQYVSSMTCDSNKKVLYYVELSTNSIWSVKYDGTRKQALIKDNPLIKKPKSISLFEDQVYVANTGTLAMVECKTYASKECREFQLNAYNVENLIVVQESRQKLIENVCDRNNCSLLCVPAEKGAKCLCHGGIFAPEGSTCNTVSITTYDGFYFKISVYESYPSKR